MSMVLTGCSNNKFNGDIEHDSTIAAQRLKDGEDLDEIVYEYASKYGMPKTKEMMIAAGMKL